MKFMSYDFDQRSVKEARWPRSQYPQRTIAKVKQRAQRLDIERVPKMYYLRASEGAAGNVER
jgi:hypothetical protein